ncbi:MAG: hypothetical protein H7A26_07935 [Spirochaetales bacterium]|nr:hypothetical protein [Spirochaetales bacterium]
MQYLTCDVCKKMISDPVRGKNYVTLRTRHICRKCNLSIAREMQDRAEAQNVPYDFLEKKGEYVAAVEKKCSK